MYLLLFRSKANSTTPYAPAPNWFIIYNFFKSNFAWFISNSLFYAYCDFIYYDSLFSFMQLFSFVIVWLPFIFLGTEFVIDGKLCIYPILFSSSTFSASMDSESEEKEFLAMSINRWPPSNLAIVGCSYLSMLIFGTN